jgi:hypothetical protein
LAVCCLVLTGCDGGSVVVSGGDDPSDVLDMTGTWAFTLNSDDLPFAFDCTEDLDGRNFAFCDRFEVTVVQDGEFFLPAPENGQGDRFCDSKFAMRGSSTVREISGVIERTRAIGPPELEIQNLEFQAGVIGDAATFALARLTVQGVNGECTLGGSYLGWRTERLLAIRQEPIHGRVDRGRLLDGAEVAGPRNDLELRPGYAFSDASSPKRRCGSIFFADKDQRGSPNLAQLLTNALAGKDPSRKLAGCSSVDGFEPLPPGIDLVLSAGIGEKTTTEHGLHYPADQRAPTHKTNDLGHRRELQAGLPRLGIGRGVHQHQ